MKRSQVGKHHTYHTLLDVEDIRGESSSSYYSGPVLSPNTSTSASDRNSDILLSKKNNTFENNWFPLAKWVYKKYKNRLSSQVASNHYSSSNDDNISSE